MENIIKKYRPNSNPFAFKKTAKIRRDLSFFKLTMKERNEVTHNYHPYPAKFTPHLIRTLIKESTRENDYIWDPFCGSGTLNVEAYRCRRHSLGSDINPLAVLISSVKTNPIIPETLNDYKSTLFEYLRIKRKSKLSYYLNKGVVNGNYEELKRWFSDSHFQELAWLLHCIQTFSSSKKLTDFALCCFSAILKKTSLWLSSSVKPQFDTEKDPMIPLKAFERQFNKMEKSNRAFFKETEDIDSAICIIKHDAKRKLPPRYYMKFDAIITSPPYLISYEYSDIFRLSTNFLYFQNNHNEFRLRFIGSKKKKRISHKSISTKFRSDPWYVKLSQLKSRRLHNSVLSYYAEMNRFLNNASNSLKKRGRFILIVGDARIESRHIPNAFSLTRIARTYGLNLIKQYRRKVSGKNLPSYRDKKTGKFVSNNNPNRVKVHKEEYILFFERS